MLWLLILRRNDVDVSALEFARLGAPVTLITLLCATTLLALASG
jgi:Na+/H+ antiporter NhaD/arsenite permease-like protein